MASLFGSASELPSPPPISAIGFPTGNRVEILQRCVASFIGNVQKFGRSVDFVIADSSQDADVRERYRRMLDSLAREHGARISYAGWEEKAHFAQALVNETGCDAEVVKFAAVRDDMAFEVLGVMRGGQAHHNAVRGDDIQDVQVLND